jgi:hypothetical protein
VIDYDMKVVSDFERGWSVGCEANGCAANVRIRSGLTSGSNTETNITNLTYEQLILLAKLFREAATDVKKQIGMGPPTAY